MYIAQIAQINSSRAEPEKRRTTNKRLSKLKNSPAVLDIFQLAGRKSRIEFRKPLDSKYSEVWKRVRIKIKEKLSRRRFKEIEMYESGMMQDIEGRVRRLSSIMNDFRGTTIEIESTPFYLIHPKSKFKKTWNIVMVIVLLYTATIMPYRISFIEGTVYDAWWYIENILNIIFFLDFIFTCFTTTYDSRNKLITHIPTIFCTYLKSWMLIDIFGFLPFDIILEGERKNYNNLLRLLRLPRLYRLMKISRIIKFFKSKQGGVLNSIFEYINLKESMLKLIGFFLTVAICAHVVTCLFYFAAKYNDFSDQTWVYRFGYMDYSPFDQYIISMYWCYTTLSTVGYGDIYPGTELEIILALLWMIFGICFFSFTIGSLASMLSGVDTKEASLTNKLNVIDEFTKETNVSKDLRTKLKAAMRYSTDAEGYSWKNKKDIFNELPIKLRYEVTMVMHKQAAERIHFFEEKDPVFITAIIPLLSPVLVNRHEYLYYTDDIPEEIYFINKGKISLVYDDKKMIFCSYTDGSYFGDIEVLRETKRKYSAMSIFSTNLLVLNYEGISTIKDDFPTVWSSMEKTAKYRELLCEIAVEKAGIVIAMKTEDAYADKKHNEIKDIYNNMISEDYEKKCSNKERFKGCSANEIFYSQIQDFQSELRAISERADMINKKLIAVESLMI